MEYLYNNKISQKAGSVYEYGLEWLETDDGFDWLISEDGYDWLGSEDGFNRMLNR